jgi:ribose transport system substrate-binding protein
MKKILLVLLAGLLLVSMVSAGGQKAASDSGKIVVAFSQMEMNNAWRVAETASIRAEAQKRGIELIYTDAQGDTAKQVSDVEDIIARKPNVILLAPREYEGLAPALAAAKRAGIPLILIDRDAQGEPGVDYASLISANFVWEGQQCAQVLVKRFGTSQEVNIVQITGTPGSSVAIDRQKGFEDELAKYPNFKIIATQNGEFTRSIAQNVMANVVQSQGGRISAVYGHDDECAIGAIQALKAAGYKPGADIAVVGVGGFKDAALLIQQNEMDATVLCSPFFGPTSFDAVEKLVRGETLPTFIQNPGRVIDKSNVDAYMPDSF